MSRFDNRVQFLTDDTELVCPADALALLQTFCPPRRLTDLEAMPTAGASDLVRLLVERGVLVPVDSPLPTPRAGGFDDPAIHARMLSDVERTRAFFAAIAAVVRPGDVVLDLGTGTGVLAVAAARAGARRVFAVEAGGIASVAERLAIENGVANRIEIVRGWSTSVVLPEQCDVLVSETVGDEPFAERVLENVLDARQRLLVPEPRLIPQAISIRVTLCEAPPAELSRRALSRAQLTEWTKRMGLPPDALGEPTRLARLAWTTPWHEAGDWRKLAEPVEVTRVDLSEHRSARIDASSSLVVEHPGELNAALVSAELNVAPGVVLRTDRGSLTNSWNAYVVGMDCIRLDRGERVRIRYRRGYRAPILRVDRD